MGNSGWCGCEPQFAAGSTVLSNVRSIWHALARKTKSEAMKQRVDFVAAPVPALARTGNVKLIVTGDDEKPQW